MREECGVYGGGVQSLVRQVLREGLGRSRGDHCGPEAVWSCGPVAHCTRATTRAGPRGDLISLLPHRTRWMGKRQDIRQASSQSDVYGMCISATHSGRAGAPRRSWPSDRLSDFIMMIMMIDSVRSRLKAPLRGFVCVIDIAYSLRHPDTKGTYTGETHIIAHTRVYNTTHTNRNTVSCAMPSMHSRQFAAKSISPAVGMPSVRLLEQLLPARPSPVFAINASSACLHTAL